MTSGAKERRFLKALEGLFTGAKVDGDSGFVNLMRVKHAYFESIRLDLMKKIDQRAEEQTSFREELFDKLYTFFNHYFCESGSIYYRNLPAFSRTYERVYSEDEDVDLVWKTRMLYYVKSEILVRSMPVTFVRSKIPYDELIFFIDATDIEHKKNNVRKEFVFDFKKFESAKDKKKIHLRVTYSQNGRRTNIEKIIRDVKTANGIIVSAEELNNAFRIFRMQTEADFFINKNAREFLEERFNLWMYQYLFQEESIFEQSRLDQLQAIRDTAFDIIEFIAQFEDELRKVWEKPKFARSVHYVMTLDKLPRKLIKKIASHSGIDKQITEWRQLNLVDENFSSENLHRLPQKLNIDNGISDECLFLPLDTKYFESLKLDILDTLGDLDLTLDGEVVHSENWQALNTLRSRYSGQIDCVHIDPPYNTNSRGFLYQNEYRHSSWLTMMENRVDAVNGFLKDDGTFLCHIDEHEYERLHLMMEKTGLLNAGTVVWDKRNPMTGGRGVATQHEYIIWRSRTEKYLSLRNDNIKLIIEKAEELVEEHGGINDAVKSSFSNWVTNHTDFSGGEAAYRYVDDDGRVYQSVSLRAPEPRSDPKFHIPLEHPLTKKPCLVPPNGFSRTPETLKLMINRGEIIFGVDESTQPRQKRYLTKDSRRQISSVIQDARRGKSDLDRLGLVNFPYCHSVGFYFNLIAAAANSSSDVILDYFAGSGTTAHAVVNLNRDDGGDRRYVLVEMGDYFHTVIIPRLKKVIFSKDWKNGKPISNHGTSHAFKYYSLEQYEESLKNSRYKNSKQLELDSMKSPFEQYVFFGDAKLSHVVNQPDESTIDINLFDLYPDIDIAESLSNVLGKHIRRISTDHVTFADGSVEKTNPSTMTEQEKQHFISVLKPYLWWGE